MRTKKFSYGSFQCLPRLKVVSLNLLVFANPYVQPPKGGLFGIMEAGGRKDG